MAYTEKAMPVGGLTEKKLGLATATANDVVSGKTFYSGDKKLKTGTNTNNTFDFTSLGTPTWTFEGGTGMSATVYSVNENALNIYGQNSGSGWGGGYYTFPNAINVSKYSSVKIYFMFNANNIYSGGDKTYVTVGGKATAITARNMKLCHTIDVSSASTFNLVVKLGWHAGCIGAITIYKIELE